jgi:hypothetical protein
VRLYLITQSYTKTSATSRSSPPHLLLLTFKNKQDMMVTLQRRDKLAQLEVLVAL